MENKVLASVNGKQITQEDVENFIAGMGQQGQAYRNPQGYEAVLEQLINQNLLLLDAQRNLYEREPAFKAQLNRVKDELLVNYAIEKAIATAIATPDDAKKYFEENPSPEEVTFTNISGEGWNKVIGEERAEEIASDYWKINDGDINEQTGNEYRIYVSGESEERYYVRLRCQKSYYDPDIDSLYIDAITGAIILSDGKG